MVMFAMVKKFGLGLVRDAAAATLLVALAASGATLAAAQAAEKGGLGSWYRPHEGGTQHQAMPSATRKVGPASCS